MNNFYNQEAQNFFNGTIDADMNENYRDFLSLIPDGGAILDLGCGSGRDALNFKKMGYETAALDASADLAKLAEEHIGQPVLVIDMRNLDFKDAFDGIWACASILHLSFDEIPAVFERCSAALKENGIFYSSFKYGDFQGDRNGRYFTDLNEERLSKILEKVPSLSLIKTSVTSDVRPGRSHEKWLNILLKKK